MLIDAPLKLTLEDGDKYVDKIVPDFNTGKFGNKVALAPKPSAVALLGAFGRPLPPVINFKFERTRLRWMKPDGKGGLVPK